MNKFDRCLGRPARYKFVPSSLLLSVSDGILGGELELQSNIYFLIFIGVLLYLLKHVHSVNNLAVNGNKNSTTFL